MINLENESINITFTYIGGVLKGIISALPVQRAEKMINSQSKLDMQMSTIARYTRIILSRNEVPI